jgi:hypothetical protein
MQIIDIDAAHHGQDKMIMVLLTPTRDIGIQRCSVEKCTLKKIRDRIFEVEDALIKEARKSKEVKKEAYIMHDISESQVMKNGSPSM